ncbi:MAG: restriction endonuclease [Rhodobacteraceae bacterium CG17_big_fil_post_rev_8_21_14_2_50_63_15]|nr:restriction endonuclease [Roseovarius sp.]PIV78017.1 MAG: restriction endonuclease [Rhodobacteraceae bacterium CG17_big_fil_post_rev_8_21_14_2_50_63_15]
MALSQTQKAVWEKARALGSGGQAVRLTDAACAYLLARIVADLELGEHFPEFSSDVADFFSSGELDKLEIEGIDPLPVFERLLSINPDGDMYFACLANLHKARLKYEVILENQAIPTLEQVGPRGLLQYGKLSPRGLVAFLFWRKWFFDIDNRAGQETGYLFEPVIANAVGGTPVTSSRSPVKRHRDNRKGRQVDCLLGNKAYELKIRMTIAASGQGRWGEELDFPIDCKESGFTPVLVVLDSTPNPKLSELSRAFLRQGGEVYVGAEAWEHLDSLAGCTMASFLERYVREPIDHLLSEAPNELPEFRAWIDGNVMVIAIAGEEIRILRANVDVNDDAHDEAPDDLFDSEL